MLKSLDFPQMIPSSRVLVSLEHQLQQKQNHSLKHSYGQKIVLSYETALSAQINSVHQKTNCQMTNGKDANKWQDVLSTFIQLQDDNDALSFKIKTMDKEESQLIQLIEQMNNQVSSLKQQHCKYTCQNQQIKKHLNIYSVGQFIEHVQQAILEQKELLNAISAEEQCTLELSVQNMEEERKLDEGLKRIGDLHEKVTAEKNTYMEQKNENKWERSLSLGLRESDVNVRRELQFNMKRLESSRTMCSWLDQCSVVKKKSKEIKEVELLQEIRQLNIISEKLILANKQLKKTIYTLQKVDQKYCAMQLSNK